jgi:hypothetical protein
MSAPTQDPSVAAMTATYLAASAALRSRLLSFVLAAYASQGNYRDAAAEAFVGTVVPAAVAAQQAMGALTSAYLAHLIASTAGGSAAPKGLAPSEISGAALRGVTPSEVYRRPYVQVWTDLARGKPFSQAVEAGSRRAQSIAATDLQLAKTRSSQLVLQSDHRVTGYRRVLTGTHSCALCVLASTRRYTRGDLLPIHPGCGCSTAPLFGTEQPDEVPAEQLHAVVARDLGAKYVKASGKGPVDYRDIVVTHDQNELGSVLAVRGQEFTRLEDHG